MIAAGILSIVALTSMQIMKSQTNTVTDSRINSDISQMKAEIQASISTPSHCNANFYGLTAATSTPTSINNCSSGACHGTGAIAKFTKNQADWDNTGSSTGRVRVFDLSITITPQVVIAPSTMIITTASLTVTFESRPQNTGQATKKQVATFSAPVILNNGTPQTVAGCPKSWNSTVVY